jgi:ATP-dependent Zn protease
MTEPHSQPAPDTSPDPRRVATAYHEAGHAVLALALGRPLERVTIAPGKIPFGPATLGQCRIQKGRFKPSQDELEDDMLILLAGMVAESQVTGQYCPRGAATDLRGVRQLAATRASSERQIERLERRALDKTEHLLSDAAHQQALERIARELLDKETISGRAARHFYEEACRAHAER